MGKRGEKEKRVKMERVPEQAKKASECPGCRAANWGRRTKTELKVTTCRLFITFFPHTNVKAPPLTCTTRPLHVPEGCSSQNSETVRSNIIITRGCTEKMRCCRRKWMMKPFAGYLGGLERKRMRRRSKRAIVQQSQLVL